MNSGRRYQTYFPVNKVVEETSGRIIERGTYEEQEEPVDHALGSSRGGFSTKIHFVFEYIEIWYNRKRIHSSLGYRTPAQMEQPLNQYALVA